jgi:hypothetical protein
MYLYLDMYMCRKVKIYMIRKKKTRYMVVDMKKDRFKM